MAKVIGKGIIQGHQASHGWWAESEPSDIFTDLLLDTTTGINPLLRIRPFISKDNNYKMDPYFLAKFPGNIRIDETDLITAIGSVSQSIAYDTNKASVGSSSFSLLDNGQRYVDNFSGSLLFQKFDEFNRIVFTGLSGTFVVGEVITGGTSTATGRIAAVGTDFLDLYVITGTFVTSETLTGGTSSATATSSTIELMPFRYHFKYVIIELGFDRPDFKHNDNFWFPLFKGLITNKKEDSESREVSFSLKDETKIIFDKELAPKKRGENIIDYSTADLSEAGDNRIIQMGLFYGKHAFLDAESENRDDQLLIQYINNIRLANPSSKAINTLLTSQATNILQLTDNISFKTDNTGDRIYFWLWDDTGSVTKQQWAFLDLDPVSNTNLNTIPVLDTNGNIFIDATPSDTLIFNLVSSGGTTTISLDDYFNRPTTQDKLEKYDPFVGITAESLPDNLSKILFEVLLNQVSIKEREFDAKLLGSIPPGNTTPQDAKIHLSDGNVKFLDKEITGESDTNKFYSWNDAFYYIRSYNLKICVHITKSTRARQLIDKLIEFIRGSFFITRGWHNTDLLTPDLTNSAIHEDFQTRRIKLVINQARPVFSGIPELDEKFIIQPSLQRSVADVINACSVSNFDYLKINRNFKDIQKFENRSETSIQIYGEKRLEINSKPGDIAFIYNSQGYVIFLGSHFVQLFKDPPLILNFRTGLIAMSSAGEESRTPLYEIKDLVSVREQEFMEFPGSDNTRGLFEIHKRNFNVSSFTFTFSLLWAGYLIAPDGDIDNQQWGFYDSDMTYDDDVNGISYHYW